MTNREKFLALVSEDDANTLEWIKEHKANKKLRRAAQKIANLILLRLRELKWTQKELAEKMGVSPQVVNKWVKGKENNFSIELLFRIGDYLGINLIEIPSDEPIVEASSDIIISDKTYEQGLFKGECILIQFGDYIDGQGNYKTDSKKFSKRIS